MNRSERHPPQRRAPVVTPIFTCPKPEPRPQTGGRNRDDIRNDCGVQCRWRDRISSTARGDRREFRRKARRAHLPPAHGANASHPNASADGSSPHSGKGRAGGACIAKL